jgi:uncharacterized protein (DUF427 family)
MTESVWDYPRPPRLETATRRVRVVLGGETIVDTTRAFRVLETSHPPTYYVPVGEVAPGVLLPSGGQTICEWKGAASYYDVESGGSRVERGAWTYHDPRPAFEDIRDAVAFYASRMDACYLDDEEVVAQPGDFYGGWITADIIGPFKGEATATGWKTSRP